MTREELESAVWQSLTAGLGHRERGVDPRTVEAILAAADAYAVYVGGITAERRAELEAALRKGGS